jgi:hypothetical protein
VDLAKLAVEKSESDSERSIKKSYRAQKDKESSLTTGSNKSGKIVPQLGEQAVQSTPPLKVSTIDKPVIADTARQMAREVGVTVEQLLGIEVLPNIDEKELAWKYVPGNPLVRPEESSFYQRRCADCMTGT